MNAQRLQVLLVDDEEPVLATTAAVLRTLGLRPRIPDAGRLLAGAGVAAPVGV